MGKCQYGGLSRVPIVIYKITCKMTNKIYIGNMQQNFKKRMVDHFQDVKKLMEKVVHQSETPMPNTLPAFGQEELQHHCQECSGTS
jgi:hypothetical protein